MKDLYLVFISCFLLSFRFFRQHNIPARTGRVPLEGDFAQGLFFEKKDLVDRRPGLQRAPLKGRWAGVGGCSRLQIIICLLLLTGVLSANAQTMDVQGKVEDDSGSPLAGVTVNLHGEAPAVFSDKKGHYEITVERGAVLEFSLKNHESHRVVIWDSEKVDISLMKYQPQAQIETGYASQEKRNITSAISSVDVPFMNRQVAGSFSEQLAGQVQGLTAVIPGNPGDAAVLGMRGVNSFLPRQALYIIDGTPVEGLSLTHIAPGDILDIQVLRDGAAAAIYGSRAANGVVLVSTQQGQNDRLQISYEGYAGVQTPVGGYDDFLIQDPLEYGSLLWDRYQNTGQHPPAAIFGSGSKPVMPEYLYPISGTVDENDYNYPDYLIVKSNQPGTNWWDQVFDPALITGHTFSLSQGGKPAGFYLSGSYFNQEGTLKHTGFERYSVRANSRVEVGRFRFGESIALSHISEVRAPRTFPEGESIFNQILRMHSIVPVYDIGGNYAGNRDLSLGEARNPVAMVERNQDNQNTRLQVLGNVFGEYAFTKHISARSSFGLDHLQGQGVRFTYPNYEDREPSLINQFAEHWHNQSNWIWTNTLSYQKSFRKYNIRLLAGQEWIRQRGRSITGSMEQYISTHSNAWYLNPDLADPESRQVRSTGNRSALNSLFGRFDYAYKNKYLLTASIREDASSKFGAGIKGLFYGASVGWRLSEEKFMDGMDWVEEFKIRAGFGLTGQQPLSEGNAFSSFGGGLASTYYDINGSNQQVSAGFSTTQLGNPLTQWEQTESLNLGADLSLYGGKFRMSFDAYENKHTGLLFRVPLPGTAGAATSPYYNVAAIENKGFDLLASYRTKINGDALLEASFNLSRNRNQVLELDGVNEWIIGEEWDTGIGPVIIDQIGYPVGSFYGYVADGLFQSSAEVAAHAEQEGAATGRIRFKDLNRDGTVDELDKGPIGNPHPKMTAGLNLSLQFHAWDASAALFASTGNEIFNYNKLYSEFGYKNANLSREVYTHAWGPDNPYGQIPQQDESDIYSRQSSTYYIEDGSYVRLRNIQIGYTLPSLFSERIGIRRLRVYVQGQNLFTLTGYGGIDPAIENSRSGFDTGSYPTSKTYLAGLDLSF